MSSVFPTHRAKPRLNLAPFGRWTLRDKAAQRRLCQTFLSVRFSNFAMSAKYGAAWPAKCKPELTSTNFLNLISKQTPSIASKTMIRLPLLN
jgi:hypothetical protein